MLTVAYIPKKQQIAVQEAYHSLKRANARIVTHTNSASSLRISGLGHFLCQMIVGFFLLAYFGITTGEAIAER